MQALTVLIPSENAEKCCLFSRCRASTVEEDPLYVVGSWSHKCVHDCSRFRELDVTASHVVSGVEVASGCNCEVGFAEKGKESCAE